MSKASKLVKDKKKVDYMEVAKFGFSLLKMSNQRQWHNPVLFVCFSFVTAFMFVSSIAYFIEMAKFNDVSAASFTINLTIRHTMGFICSLFIFNYLRISVPINWLKYPTTDNGPQPTMKQNIIAMLMLSIPVLTIGGAFFLILFSEG